MIQLEMREKYQRAADLLECAIHVIIDAYNLKPIVPPHDIAEWILGECLEEGDQRKKVTE